MAADVLLDERQVRQQMAWKVRAAKDVKFPELKFWNYGPCENHETTQTDCEFQMCGGQPFKHQRVGATWLYLVERGLLADVPGAGKTNSVLMLLALMKQRSELTDRAVIVCQAPAVEQWYNEASRWTPKLDFEVGIGTKPQRIQRYSGNWDALVLSYQMLLQDLEFMVKLNPQLIVSDDVDPLRNPDTATAKAVNRLARDSQRVIVINATPLQIRLNEMHASTVPIGGEQIFGSARNFERRYIQQEMVTDYTSSGKQVIRTRTTGTKNFAEYRRKLAPLYLRRNYNDLDDVSMPDVAPPETVWFDLHHAQREKYTELQEGVLRLLHEEGEKVKHASALAKVVYGQEICASLCALGEADGPQASVKMDWLEDQLTGTWAEESVVVYAKNIGTIKALETRLGKHNIGVSKIWGVAGTDRAEELRYFREGKNRVAVGTSAMERSLNMQTARVCVFFDSLLNPARMNQILGRVRRAGSQHSTVYPFTLLARATQEERYLEVLKNRQALADHTWGESNELYQTMTPQELLGLIAA